MTRNLKKLDPGTARLLHSTQSVSSVHGVVKEIVENSLDAGASNVVVKLVDYGLERIDVLDNGSGVAQDDLPLLVLPGYTSKVASEEDLQSLRTYGFRGQALAAILAVARVTVASGTKDQELGLSLVYDHRGNIVSRKVLPWDQGTRVTVEELFKMVPVRRKHMNNVKAKAAELKKVQSLLQALAIACPGVGISLHHNGSVIWTKTPAKTLREAVCQVFGIPVLQSMHYAEFRDESGTMTIKCFLPKVEARGVAKGLCACDPDKSIVLVNGRPVFVKKISRCLQREFSLAVDSAQHTWAKHPVCVVRIDVPPADVDVNLEPDKTAVGFAKEEAVLAALENILRNAFKSDAVPETKDVELESGSRDDVSPSSSSNKENRGAAINNVDIAATPAFFEVNNHVNTGASVPPERRTYQFGQPESRAPAPKDAGTAEPVRTTSVPKRSLPWSFGMLRSSQGTPIEEPTKVLGPVSKRPLTSPMKNWTPSKRQTTPTKCPKAQRRLTDLLFGQHPKSARELFCEQRKKEVLSQAPNTTLDELDDLLRDDWSSLTPDQRLEYEERAKQSRGNHSLTSTQFRPAQPVVPSPRSDVRRKEATSTRAFVQLPFCMKSVREKLGDYCELSQQPLSRVTTLVIGRLPDAPKEGWLVCHKGKLATLNITCLRETALFRKLKQTYVVPAEELRPPLVVTASMLPDPSSWSVLGRLKQERRDQSGFSYVVDPLLTSNGFHLRLVPGHPDRKADVVRKASGLDLAHLGQILDGISRSASDSVAVEEVRPPSVLELLKLEAKRMVQGSVPSPPEDVRDGAEELDERCLHGNAICAAFFDTKDVANT